MDPWTPNVPRQPEPAKQPWWRDGQVVLQIATMLFGFAGTWLTMYYQAELTRQKVEAVEHRQQENVKRLERVEDDSAAVRSVIVGDK